MITHMLHYARDSFTAEVAKRAEEASFMPLCDLSVLRGEIWVITRYGHDDEDIFFVLLLETPART